MNFDVRRVQTRLAALGFDPGPIDGVRGPRTDAAIVAFKRAMGLRARAYVGPITLHRLESEFRMRASVQPGRADVPPWITRAESMLGAHEVRDNGWLRRFLGSDGRALGDPAKLPWCGDFVETCIRLELSNEPFPGALGQNPYWARNWVLFGQATEPVFGAIGVITRGSGGHVFFLIGEDDRHWYALGGNQSNAVTRTLISKSRELLGWRWPVSWSGTAPPLPRMTPGDLKLSTNEA